MPSGHHPPVLDQAGAHGSSGQSAVKTGFAPSAIPIKPSPGKLAAAPNPHRRPSLHRFSAGSFFGGFRTPALLPGIPLAPGRHPKPFPIAVVAPAGRMTSLIPSRRSCGHLRDRSLMPSNYASGHADDPNLLYDERNSQIAAAISRACVSSAKCPVSKKRTTASGMSRLKAAAPAGKKNGSFLPQAARKCGLWVWK